MILILILALGAGILPASADENSSVILTPDGTQLAGYVTTTATWSANGSVVVLPPNDPNLPLVTLVEKQSTAAEAGPISGEILVVRAGHTNSALTVSYHISGTARNEIDYQPLLGSVTIAAGEYAAPITVTPVDDGEAEPRETVVIELLTALATGATNRTYQPFWPGRAVVTIRDNDGGVNHPPTVTLANPPTGGVFKGPLDLHLLARVDDRDGDIMKVEFFANGHSVGVVSNSIVPLPMPAATDPDFAASAFASPNTSGEFNPQSANLAAGANGIAVPFVPFSLVWSNAPAGEHDLRAVATDDQGAMGESAIVRIRIVEDTSVSRIEVFASDSLAAEGAAASGELNSATFVIVRNGAAVEELDLQLRVSGTATRGDDYTGLATTVRLPAGVRRTEITVIPVDDSLVEGVESVHLQLLPAACLDIFPRPPGCYDLGRHLSATVWIRDNDAPETNQPPVVSMLSPASHTVLVNPDRLLLVAAARDNDGFVRTVEFFAGNDSLGIVSNVPNLLADVTSASGLAVLPPWYLTWTNISPGIHVIRAKATDNEGGETVSRPVEVRVVSRDLLPVVQIEAVDRVAAEPGAGNGIPVAGTTAGGGTSVTVIDASGNGSLLTGFLGETGTTAPEILNTARFRLARSGELSDPLTVFLQLGGSARNGVDYLPVSHRVVFAAGSRTADVEIIPIDDSESEGPEDVLVGIIHPVFATTLPGTTVRDYLIGPNHRAEATILDNDGSVNNHPPEARILRPAAGAVLRSGEPIPILGHAVDVDGYFVRFEAFANGHKVAEQAINYIQAPPPGMRGTFNLDWTNASPGTYQVRVRATDNDGAADYSPVVTVEVVNLPEPTVVIVEAVDANASEAANQSNAADVNPGAFVLRRRGGDPANSLAVHYSMHGTARNGVDYHRLGGTAEFAAGQLEKRIQLMPIDDNLVEPAESATLRLEAPVVIAIFPPPPGSYLVGERRLATVVIHDNDEQRNRAPRVTVVSPNRNQRFTAPADLEIGVHTRDVDGWVSQMEFFAGTNKLGDSVVHFIRPPEPGGRQRFSLVWTNVPAGEYAIRAKATDNLGAGSWSDPVPVVVRGRDAAPIVNIFARDPRAVEGTNSAGVADLATFVVTRRGNTNTALTLFLEFGGRAENGVDYETVATSIVLPAGESSIPVTITPIDDTETERPESVTVRLYIPANVLLAEAYEFGLHRRAAAVILDNDATAPPVPGNPATPAAEALADGLVHVVLRSDAVEEVIVESSGNLLDWFEIARGFLTNGEIDFVEADTLEQPGRYYRIVPVNAEAAPVAAQRRF